MNSVAQIDHTFNDNLETKPRRKGGRPRKQPITPLITGFPSCIAQSAYFNVPTAFMDVIAAIDNLAELKVVMYIMRHTWGFREFETPLRLTIDELMHGRFKRDGSRMDSGTGLSKSAVVNGLDRAMKHGFIDCLIDEHDLALVQHYYRLSVQSEASPESPEIGATFEETATTEKNTTVLSEGTTVLFTEDTSEQETEAYDPYTGTILAQSADQKIFVSESELTNTSEVVNNYIGGSYQLHRTHYRTQQRTSLTNDIRIASTPENFEEEIRFVPPAGQLPKAKAPAFIRNMITDFSRDLGDHEHIFSNISQAAKIYRTSGMSEDTFLQALYDARAVAKKATQIKHLNSQGRANRMPYFFRCLASTQLPSSNIVL